MKKISIFVLLSLLLIGKSTQAMDMYIKMEIFPKRQQQIYKEVVNGSGLAKSPEDAIKDNYHLTLAQINGAQGAEKGEELRKFLINKLSKSCQGNLNSDHAIILKDVYAGRYTVNREYDNCPIVLFPDHETNEVLKVYNLVINEALAEFNTKHKTNFRMGEDLVPSSYSPHITLADKNWINKHCQLDRDRIITAVNKKIEEAKQINHKKTYDFMLKVPEK